MKIQHNHRYNHNRNCLASLKCLSKVMFMMVLCFFTSPISAKAGPYQLSGMVVEATAKDAVTAKERAIAEGQKRALEIVLERIVSSRQHSKIPELEKKFVEDLVAGISIHSEKTGPTSYSAILTFRFDERAIRSKLSRYGVRVVDSQADPVLIIPIFREGDVYFLWYSNPMMEAWRTFDTVNTVTPIRLPLGNDMDQGVSVHRILSQDPTTLSDLRIRYGVNEILINICETDHARSFYKCILEGVGPNGPLDLREEFSGGNDPFAIAQAAAGSFLGQIEEKWKTDGRRKPAARLSGTPLSVVVSFEGQKEWIDLRERLLAIPGVNNIAVKAINPKGAQLTVYYSGALSSLSQRLSIYRLELINAGRGYIIRPQT